MTTETVPPPLWTFDPADRSIHEREAAFQRYLEQTANYFAAVVERGDSPWFSSQEERREFWFRRFRRPDPPEGLFTDLADIRRLEHNIESPGLARIPKAESDSQPLSALHLTDDTAKEINAA